MKAFGNSGVIEVESERDLFIKHGLHMNSRGKELIAERIVREILDILREEKSDPIMMKGKDEQGMIEEGTHIPVTKETQESVIRKNEQRGVEYEKRSQEKGELCENSEGCQNIEAQASVQSKRPRRLPINRNEDFLWETLNNK
jgi:hypothetical protein